MFERVNGVFGCRTRLSNVFDNQIPRSHVRTSLQTRVCRTTVRKGIHPYPPALTCLCISPFEGVNRKWVKKQQFDSQQDVRKDVHSYLPAPSCLCSPRFELGLIATNKTVVI
ncbi:hypothetical protein SK128_023329 [Halocaridina rubra]|uniref:Uncharacterized protein n=1 Tax=Halocaridina rubra TaxID=373956 RepID=A0AAN8WX98_HALRR